MGLEFGLDDPSIAFPYVCVCAVAAGKRGKLFGLTKSEKEKKRKLGVDSISTYSHKEVKLERRMINSPVFFLLFFQFNLKKIIDLLRNEEMDEKRGQRGPHSTQFRDTSYYECDVKDSEKIECSASQRPSIPT